MACDCMLDELLPVVSLYKARLHSCSSADSVEISLSNALEASLLMSLEADPYK